MKISNDQKFEIILALIKLNYGINKIWQRYNEILTTIEGDRRESTQDRANRHYEKLKDAEPVDLWPDNCKTTGTNVSDAIDRRILELINNREILKEDEPETPEPPAARKHTIQEAIEILNQYLNDIYKLNNHPYPDDIIKAADMLREIARKD